jgi:dihydrofolate reductase
MGKIFADISVSLDGFVAGTNPTLDEPLGHGGEGLHEWVVKTAAWRKPHGLGGGETGTDSDIMAEAFDNLGAVIMGRKMYSGGTGPWDGDPNPDGWWGDAPPFHVPVFVLTHHTRERLYKKGGTSFTFVTNGIQSAFDQAKATAGEKNVSIAGGASVIGQYMKVGLLEELQLHIVPILLGGGTPLFGDADTSTLEKIRVIDSPLVTHIKFRVTPAASGRSSSQSPAS